MKVCSRPFRKGGFEHGCGQCIPCRVSRRRMWAHRILLEAECHSASYFDTWTYDDDHLPKGGTLDPNHTKLCMYKLRTRFSALGRRFRYYLVGEYGGRTLRPHYHVALFGLSQSEDAVLVREAWGKGNTYPGELNKTTAEYIAGYIVDKLSPREAKRSQGRYPEFARMSNRPGIGASRMAEIARILFSDPRFQGVDVPFSLERDGRQLPLGRYLRNILRKEMGFSDEMAEEAASVYLLSEWKEKWQIHKEASQIQKVGWKIYEDKRAMRIRTIKNKTTKRGGHL